MLFNAPRQPCTGQEIPMTLIWSELTQWLLSSRFQKPLSCPWSCPLCPHRKTRWVDGTPTTEVTWSLSGRSIHLTLVTKWSWSWSWMTYCHPLCAMSISPPILRYSYFKIWPWKSMVKVMCVVKGQGHVWPWKFKGQGYGQGQTHWSHLRPGIQSICLLFVSWQSDHFWLR